MIEKLTRNNHQSALRGVQVASFINPMAKPPLEFLPPKTDGDKEPPVLNPDCDIYLAKDQQVLSYLLTSLSCEIGSQVSGATTVSATWTTTEGMFMSQSQARVISTRMALATASKG